MRKRSYGRYGSFGAWMLDNLMLNLTLLVGLTWMMGCYDAIGFMASMKIDHLFGIKAI